MKTFISFILLCCTFVLSAQETFRVDSVVAVPNYDANQIFNAATKWLVTTIDPASANAVVSSDQNTLSATAKAVFKFEVNNLTWQAMSGHISCTIDFSARDGRFKIRFSDFVHDAARPGWDEGMIYKEIPDDRNKGLAGKQHREVYKRAKEAINDWTLQQINALTQYIKSYSNLQEENW
jgi:hypothetical protein